MTVNEQHSLLPSAQAELIKQTNIYNENFILFHSTSMTYGVCYKIITMKS